ncbi:MULTISPECIES: hypothetical protein [Haloferacaceae]|uniref:DUF8173 domain-containing protein n=1 Tax=Halorubrum glutamatedens TaxID=2707018 RepID=A0ABD5QQF1_9EURY|nr:hypothetical protein [Halobellus captivus]
MNGPVPPLSAGTIDAPSGIDVTVGQGVAGGAVAAFLTTLAVAAVLVAVRPAYVERMTDAVLERPASSFLYGLFLLLALFVSVFMLAITGIGLLLAVPLLLVAYVVWAVGAAVAYLAVADRLVGHDDGWPKAILVAAALNGVLAATGVGALVALAIGATGFGAVLDDWFG